MLEKLLTPIKFKNNRHLLNEFLENVGNLTTFSQITDKIQAKEIKQCACLENYLQYKIDENHQAYFLTLSHIHCETTL